MQAAEPEETTTESETAEDTTEQKAETPEPAEEADTNQEASTMEISYNVTGPAAKSWQVSRLAEKQPSEMEGLFCIKVCPFRQHLNKFACNPHKH